MNAIIKSGLYSLLLAGAALFIFIYGCKSKVEEDTISDKPLSVFQEKLLDIAFETATAIPVNPHLKDRSKAQENVIETCLKLDQPKRATGYIEKIDNWQRGLCYADLAFYCAKQSYSKEADLYLKFAEDIAKDDHGQEWRNNQINTIIAKTRIELGQILQADNIKKVLANSETDKLAQAEAKISTEASFEEQIRVLEQLLLDNSQWRLEHKIGLMAKLSELRYRAGDVERAQIDTDAALALFNDQKSKIADIYRAQTLLLIAQAYQSMGNAKAALAVYKLAIEEGVENPNSRPRAEDLSAICCSMALNAVEPDSELWLRINQISEGLGQPW